MSNDNLYIMTKDLHAILFPNKQDRFTPKLGIFPEPRETYLEKLFERKPIFFRGKFSESDDVSNEYTKIEVSVILCDKHRNHIYLIYDDSRNGVFLPGGSIHREDLDTSYMDTESILLTSLMRNILVQFDSVYGESIYYTMNYDVMGTARSKLTNIMYSKFTNVTETNTIYYSYLFPNEKKRKFIIYYVFEFMPIHNSIYGDIPPLPRGLPRGVIPISKELFRISLRCKTWKEVNSLFDLDFNNPHGVIFESYGRSQLKAIFNTTPLLF